MKDFFINLPSQLLRRTDIDAETKLILGYILTRLQIDTITWTFSKSDVAEQLGLTKPLVARRFQTLTEQGVFIYHSTVKVNGGEMELFAANPEKLKEFVTCNATLPACNTTLQASNTVLQPCNTTLPISKIYKEENKQDKKENAKQYNNKEDAEALLRSEIETLKRQGVKFKWPTEYVESRIKDLIANSVKGKR